MIQKKFWKPKISNCLIWALWMVFTRKGAIKAHKSEYGWWPHFLWEDINGETWEYVPPIKVRVRGISQIFPIRIVLFRGIIKKAGIYKKLI